MKENLYEPVSKVKNILCYGDSNTWGWVPSSMGLKRYSFDNRWPGILQNLLGDGYKVFEEGLGARTTMFDDPRIDFPLRNGAETLPNILESNLPLNFVIIMLGTTDTKEMLNLNVEDITNGMKKLIKIVKNMKILKNCSPAKILIIVPPIVLEEADFASKLFKGATAKTQELVKSYENLAKEENVYYLNPTNEIKVDKIEGVHMDNTNHEKLAKLIANKLLEIK
jgi:lysophospholipase L1-like esterase